MNMGRLQSARRIEDDARWTALRRRQSGFPEPLFYGVTSTGIFCRSDCRSRLPQRKNVIFFTSPGEALSAGFRPCKRCQPNGPGLAAELDGKLQQACRCLETQERLSVSALARVAGMSSFHFQRLFKTRIGLTPKQYQLATRLNRFRQELRRQGTATAALYEAGFSSSSRAYEQVGARLGMTPRQYQSGGKGLVIKFACQNTSFGLVLVAATDKGVCRVDFGSNPRQLRQRLQQEFPDARIQEDLAELGPALKEIDAYLTRPNHNLYLPLDIRGTVFQQRVWQALRQIPPGQTVSYRELAAKIGAPKASRAVGRACAANQIALAIPCHRALRADGQLGGYRWGTERKAALLRGEFSARETAARRNVQLNR